MISVKKIVKQIATFSLFGLGALSLCTAEPNSANTKLIDLMDVMLEDFVNPTQKKEEIIQQKQPNSPKAQKPVAQALSDPAETLENNNYTNVLPQNPKPNVPEHLPMVEQHTPATTVQNNLNSSTVQTVQSPNTPLTFDQNQALPLPSNANKTETAQQNENTTVKNAQIEQRPVVVEHEERFEPVETKENLQPVKTITVEARPSLTQTEKIEETVEPKKTEKNDNIIEEKQTISENLAENIVEQPKIEEEKSTQTVASQKVEVEAKTVEPVTEEENLVAENEEIIFGAEILDEEPPFNVQNFLGGNIEYNSYNTKFKTIGASLMYERVIRPADSIGVLGGGFVSIDSVYKKGQKLSLSSGIVEGEIALFYRHYLMSDAMKEAKPYPYGMFLQPELGVGVGLNLATKKMIKDQLGLKPSPIVALRTGYRAFILKSPIYIEPFVRIGYPFVAGGGIGIGLKL